MENPLPDNCVIVLYVTGEAAQSNYFQGETALQALEKQKLRLAADLKNLHAFKAFILEHAGREGLDQDKCRELELAADEILTNIISYAYPEGPGDITVICGVDDGGFFVEVKDSGVSFNPLESKEPEAPQNVEDTRVGGLGIFLVRRMVDGIQYRREDNLNVLRLYKKGST